MVKFVCEPSVGNCVIQLFLLVCRFKKDAGPFSQHILCYFRRTLMPTNYELYIVNIFVFYVLIGYYH